jgi:23S rRNA (adenine2503-C2)-methyltransferase
MHVAELRQRLRALGARPVHEERVLRQWARAESQAHGRRRPEDFLPRSLRAALPTLEAELQALAVLRADHAGADGARRLLVGLADGRSVEAVLLPRGGLCVSSQVGCAVGCVFCSTGMGGLERQLGSAEIVAQVALARRLRPVTKVVFMGMGEPAHNLEAVLEAIDVLGTGGGIGHKQLVFSTVGDRRVFERLPQGRVKPALALSLHSTDAAVRARLLPRAPDIAPDELVALGDVYARATGYPMQVQWTLLDGINDGADEIDGLARLLAGKHAVLNLIPYNAVDGLAFARPDAERSRAIARELHRRGILTKLRQSAGQDVRGGCGQLRARHERSEGQVIEIVAGQATARSNGAMPTGSSTLGCVATQPAPSSESRDGRHGCSRPEQSFSSPYLSGSNALRPCGPRIKV